jgi:hypothetical protein
MSHGIFRHRNGFTASFSSVYCILYTSFKQGVGTEGGEEEREAVLILRLNPRKSFVLRHVECGATKTS